MQRAALIAPSIALAEKGFVLDQGDIDMFATATDDFKKDPASAAIFLNKGEPFAVGQKMVQKDLAKTLKAISAKGTDGFYKGPVGAAIVASSQAGKGIITQADLDQYKTRELAPVECDYRGYQRDLGAAAELGRRGHLRDAQHPRGLSAQGPGLSLGAGGALPDRSHAPRLRGPQQLPGRPGLREEPARPPARQGLRREDPRRHRPEEGRRLQGHQARRRAARRQQHHALLDRRPVGQRGLGDLHAERLVRRQGHGRQDRRAAEQRDGRLHLQDRRAEHVRPGAGRGQRHRARASGR